MHLECASRVVNYWMNYSPRFNPVHSSLKVPHDQRLHIWELSWSEFLCCVKHRDLEQLGEVRVDFIYIFMQQLREVRAGQECEGKN